MPPPFEVLPPGGGPARKPKPQGIIGWIIAGGIMAAKYGFLLLKTAKTSISMLVMIWIYSLFFGWRFAVGFVLLLFVHEMGHVVAAKWLGIPVTAPLFIPGIGALITMKQNPRDAWTEALMAYGGPLAGCVGGWICLWAGLQFHLLWVVGVASVTFVLNLFNMIPVPPMDGGRICAAVSAWFWLIGVVLLGAAFSIFIPPVRSSSS